MTKRIALLMALGLLIVVSVGCRHYYGYDRYPYYGGSETQYYTAPTAPYYAPGTVTYNQVQTYPYYSSTTTPYYYYNGRTYYYPNTYYGTCYTHSYPTYSGHTYGRTHQPHHGTAGYQRPAQPATGHRPGSGYHQRPGGSVTPTPRPPAPAAGRLHVQQVGKRTQLVIPVPPLPKPPLLPTRILNPLKIKR